MGDLGFWLCLISFVHVERRRGRHIYIEVRSVGAGCQRILIYFIGETLNSVSVNRIITHVNIYNYFLTGKLFISI